ncbi:anaphase-promoting complex, cyclosome, subunit 3 domain-containing protein [Ditylenchus destructor]|uniref:Cell division cycle protein 27 homolog n=1 Tax=Ditylenchus destructor TaxID=166010 RepID=A0AAD4RAY2_9BILA|nr:anaphase-promoting complex, cyclosome, subunit 3 domain-containing protein [Ditylenchus destructor]
MKVLLSAKNAPGAKSPKRLHHSTNIGIDQGVWYLGPDEAESSSTSTNMSKEVEELIETCLDHFANEDAIVLAEAYHNRVNTERSLFIWAQTLCRSNKTEAAYHLLNNNAFDGPQCRYLFAKCAYTLNRLQESEAKLCDEHSSDKIMLHPVFNGTTTESFAHSLLAKILGETSRTEAAKSELVRSIKANPLLWSSIKNLCDNKREGETSLSELFPKSLSDMMHHNKQKRLHDRKVERYKAKKPNDQSVDIMLKKCSENVTPLSTPTNVTSNNAVLPTGSAASANALPRSRHSRVNTSAEPNAIETRRSTRLFGTNQEDENFSKFNPPPSHIAAMRGGVAASGGLATKTRTRGQVQVIPTNTCTKILIDDNGDLLKQEVVKRRASGHPLSSVNAANTISNTTTTITTGPRTPKTEGDEKEGNEDNEFEAEEPMDLENAENDPFQRENKPGTTPPEVEVNRDAIYCDTADWMVNLGKVQELLSNFRCAEAMEMLDSTIPAPFSQLALCLELRARIFFENGEYQKACDVFEECRQRYPHRVEGMEIFSTAMWQLQNQHKLSALCAELTNTARNEPETWCVAANCFSLEKQHETAVECLERAIRLDSRFGYAYSLLGHELIILNQLGRAAQAFRQAIVCSPNDYRAWYGLGLVHFKEEQLSLAKMNLQKAVGINPTNVIVLCQMAVVEQALGNTDAAMEHLEKALGYAPNNVACRYHKARLLFDIGEYAKSLDELMELKALSPDEAHVFYLLGRVHRKMGNHHAALLSYSWATEIDPRGEQNHSALSDQGPYDDDPIDFSESRNSNTSF